MSPKRFLSEFKKQFAKWRSMLDTVRYYNYRILTILSIHDGTLIFCLSLFLTVVFLPLFVIIYVAPIVDLLIEVARSRRLNREKKRELKSRFPKLKWIILREYPSDASFVRTLHWLKIIFISRAMLNQGSPEALDAEIAHEIGHLDRADRAIQLRTNVVIATTSIIVIPILLSGFRNFFLFTPERVPEYFLYYLVFAALVFILLILFLLEKESKILIYREHLADLDAAQDSSTEIKLFLEKETLIQTGIDSPPPIYISHRPPFIHIKSHPSFSDRLEMITTPIERAAEKHFKSLYALVNVISLFSVLLYQCLLWAYDFDSEFISLYFPVILAVLLVFDQISSARTAENVKIDCTLVAYSASAIILATIISQLGKLAIITLVAGQDYMAFIAPSVLLYHLLIPIALFVCAALIALIFAYLEKSPVIHACLVVSLLMYSSYEIIYLYSLLENIRFRDLEEHAVWLSYFLICTGSLFAPAFLKKFPSYTEIEGQKITAYDPAIFGQRSVRIFESSFLRCVFCIAGIGIMFALFKKEFFDVIDTKIVIWAAIIVFLISAGTITDVVQLLKRNKFITLGWVTCAFVALIFFTNFQFPYIADLEISTIAHSRRSVEDYLEFFKGFLVAFLPILWSCLFYFSVLFLSKLDDQ